MVEIALRVSGDKEKEAQVAPIGMRVEILCRPQCGEATVGFRLPINERRGRRPVVLYVTTRISGCLASAER